MPKFFITATDTDAGKTFVSSMLLYAAALDNKKTLGFKPVSSGIELVKGKRINKDIELLKATSNVKIPDSAQNLYLFEQAIAPHIASKLGGKSIALELIKQQVDDYSDQADFVLVEGVGGWEVPLNNTQGVPELAKMLAYPIIVVVRIKTGCINHALLTINAIRQQGLQLAGWVANQVKDDDVARANISSIEQRTRLSCLAQIPELESMSYLQIQDFFNNLGSANKPPHHEIIRLYFKLLELS
ncbi:MAG: dethiobiotin synthase [Pseudomonadota bacterium]